MKVQPDARGWRIVRRDYVYPCTATVDLQKVLPDALYRQLKDRVGRYYLNTLPENGTDCPFFVPLGTTSQE